MIFVTTGTQKGFDRLVKIVDKEFTNDEDVFMQIGNGEYIPNKKYERYIDAEKYKETFNNSDVIISHIGIGTILNAIKYKKRIVLIPRLKKFNEHRNNHQVDTASYLVVKGCENNICLDLNELKKSIEMAQILKLTLNELDNFALNIKKRIIDL